MKTLLYNIKDLLQIREPNVVKVAGKDMQDLPKLSNAYLVIENDLIVDYGIMAQLPKSHFDHKIDATNKIVLPTWCDSHSHIVYAGNREQEFVDRINGLTYEAIAEKGGGILNSAKKISEITEEQLYNESKTRLEEVIQMGTGAIEIKSGYGLSTISEIKMLNVIQKLKKNYPIAIKATFLGAHAFPAIYKNNHKEYIDLIVNEMIPKIGALKIADFIDVFCEKNYFSVEESDRIIKAGKENGLLPKIHVNQFNIIGGVAMAVENQALSVDHLEIISDEDIQFLQNSNTMPVALPACSYFLSIPYTPARKIIASGLPLALATDYNPGSCPSGNMNFVVATACIKMQMTPEEAINAATINGAYAMGISTTHGSITIGKKANLIITKPLHSFYEIPYSFGSQIVESVFINGIQQ